MIANRSTKVEEPVEEHLADGGFLNASEILQVSGVGVDARPKLVDVPSATPLSQSSSI